MNTTIGERLRLLRQQHGLTQQQVSTLSGIGQSDISRLETGDLLRSAAIAQVQTALGANDVVAAPLPKSSVHRLFRTVQTRWRPMRPGIKLDVRLNQARLSFGAERVDEVWNVLQQRTDSRRLVSILSVMEFDSSHESFFVMRLLAEGWQFRKASPLGLGCRWLVRDRSSGDYIGDVLRWALLWRRRDGNLILLPQVSMTARNPYRIDLAGVAVREGRRAELAVEVDGPAHAEQRLQDAERTMVLNLPTMRVDTPMLKSRTDLTPQVVAFAWPLCRTRPRTVRAWR